MWQCTLPASYHQDDENEDAVYVNAAAGVAAVCDGLAGHDYSRLASLKAIEVIDERSSDVQLPWARPTAEAVNEAVCALDEAQGKTFKPACAIALAAVDGLLVDLAWAGDSRAYRLHEDQLLLLTDDHDVLAQRVREGKMSAGKARGIRRLIDGVETESDAWRAAGAHGKKLFRQNHLMITHMGLRHPLIDNLQAEFASGDLLVLTTDGVHNNLNHQMMQQIAASVAPEDVATALCEGAFARAEAGEPRCKPDDITAAVAVTASA